MDSDNADHRWYALQVRPRLERLTTGLLIDRGYESYLPLLKSRRRGSDVTRTLELPLFPGYTFCRFSLERRLPILLVPEVVSLVGIGDTPTAIPDGEMVSIRTVIASGRRYGPSPDAGPEQSVRFGRGGLAGVEGKVVRVESELRLVVALPVIRRSLFVEIDRDCIDILPQQPSYAAPNGDASSSNGNIAQNRPAAGAISTLQDGCGGSAISSREPGLCHRPGRRSRPWASPRYNWN